MAKIDINTTIKRPIEEVFAVLSDASNGSKWASGGFEPKKTSEDARVGDDLHVVADEEAPPWLADPAGLELDPGGPSAKVHGPGHLVTSSRSLG